MSNLTLIPQWHNNINQVEKVEPILGGASGNMNLATKQLAENILWLRDNLQAYKVGDLYTTTLNHDDSAEVAAHLGYGTWAKYGEGRTLVGHSDSVDDPASYKTMGNEFGENTHKLTVDEMPTHNHDLYDAVGVTGQGGLPDLNNTQSSSISSSTAIGDAGGGVAHNNIQPSIVVAYWLRTA